MTMRPWAKLARMTVAGAVLATSIVTSGASIASAQEDASSCEAGTAGGLQIPEAVEGKFNSSNAQAC